MSLGSRYLCLGVLCNNNIALIQVTPVLDEEIARKGHQPVLERADHEHSTQRP
jgi:hypothetical protein